MDEFLHVLSNFEDNELVYHYTNDQFNNLEFGKMMFFALHGNIPNLEKCNKNSYSLCCFLLGRWTKMNLNRLQSDYLVFHFQSIKELILENHQCSLLLSDILIETAKQRKFYEIYSTHYQDFFQNIEITFPKLPAIINILKFAAKHFKRAANYYGESDLNLFLQNVNQFILPIIGNPDLHNSDYGFSILKQILSVFKYPFIRAGLPLENASTIFQFLEKVQQAYINNEIKQEKQLDLVLGSVCFMKSFYKNKKYSKIFKQNSENILQIYFQILFVAVNDMIVNHTTKYNSLFLSSILQVLELYVKNIPLQHNIIDLILEVSKLSQQDIDNFTQNPNLFYYDIYDTEPLDNLSVPRLGRSLIYSIFQKSIQSNDSEKMQFGFQSVQYLLSKPPAENIIRCIGILGNIFDGSPNDLIINQICQYYMTLLSNNRQDPLFVAAILDLIARYVPFQEIEQNSKLMETLPHFMNSKFDIICINACFLFQQLINNDIFPFDGAINVLVDFLPRCSTGHVFDSIRKMLEIQKEIVLPYSESLLDGLFDSFSMAFQQIASEDIEQEENGERTIEENLDFYTMLLKSTGSYLVKPFFLDITKEIFDRELTDCHENLKDMLSSIFITGSALIPQFIQIIFEHVSDYSSVWNNFIGELCDPFYALISLQPETFIQLNISQFLIEFCMKVLTHSSIPDSDIILDIGTLLSWIILLDTRIEQSVLMTIKEASKSVLLKPSEAKDICYLSCFLDIYAAISFSRKIVPEPQIIEEMIQAVQHNWALRIQQKQLYIRLFFFLALNTSSINPELPEQLINIAFHLINQENLQANDPEDEYIYEQSYPNQLSSLSLRLPYNSPVLNYSYIELIMPALKVLSESSVALIQAQYPEIFHQLILAAQQIQQ